MLFRSGCPCVVTMAAFTALYVILGGYMATAINDFIQGFIMLIRKTNTITDAVILSDLLLYRSPKKSGIVLDPRCCVITFVLGGRSVGPWLTAFAYGTSYFSAVVFVGYAGQFGWKYGIASTWIGIGNALIGSLLIKVFYLSAV